MSTGFSFQLSTEVLEWARTSMGYTIEQAAKKAGVSNERFESWEKGEKLPTYKQLEKLAETVYKRPLALLFLKSPPKEDPIQKDFRNFSNADIIHLSSELRLALRKARRYQLILDEITHLDHGKTLNKFLISLNDNPENCAKLFREFMGLSLATQKSWNIENALTNFRNEIEKIGICVFQLKMPISEARAFCLTGNNPLIVLNKDDSKNARVFSLFHELCHILFNLSGVFRDGETGQLNDEYSKIEYFCNVFAASFIVPDDDFNDELRNVYLGNSGWTEGEIQKLAKVYNVSNEVIARKLMHRKLITPDFFWQKKRLWDTYAKAAKERENAKLKEQDSGIPQDIKVISEKGRAYVSSVVSAYQQGTISSSDLTNYLEMKLDHLPKILNRINN